MRRWLERSDTPLLVTITDWKPPSTNSQKAKIHAMIDELAAAVGYTSGEMKQILKDEVGAYFTDRKGNRRPKSIADYSKQELSDLIEHTYRLAAEAGVLLESAA